MSTTFLEQPNTLFYFQTASGLCMHSPLMLQLFWEPWLFWWLGSGIALILPLMPRTVSLYKKQIIILSAEADRWVPHLTWALKTGHILRFGIKLTLSSHKWKKKSTCSARQHRGLKSELWPCYEGRTLLCLAFLDILHASLLQPPQLQPHLPKTWLSTIILSGSP